MDELEDALRGPGEHRCERVADERDERRDHGAVGRVPPVALHPGLDEVAHAQADGEALALLPETEVAVGKAGRGEDVVARDYCVKELRRRGEEAEGHEEDSGERRLHECVVRGHALDERLQCRTDELTVAVVCDVLGSVVVRERPRKDGSGKRHGPSRGNTMALAALPRSPVVLCGGVRVERHRVRPLRHRLERRANVRKWLVCRQDTWSAGRDRCRGHALLDGLALERGRGRRRVLHDSNLPIRMPLDGQRVVCILHALRLNRQILLLALEVRPMERVQAALLAYPRCAPCALRTGCRRAMRVAELARGVYAALWVVGFGEIEDERSLPCRALHALLDRVHAVRARLERVGRALQQPLLLRFLGHVVRWRVHERSHGVREHGRNVIEPLLGCQQAVGLRGGDVGMSEDRLNDGEKTADHVDDLACEVVEVART